MLKKYILTGLIALTAIALIVPASAGSVSATFVASDSGYVDLENPDTNYASADSIKVSANIIHNEIGYIAFSISSLPGDAEITKVVLELNVKSFPLDDGSMDISVYNTSSFSSDSMTGLDAPSLDTELSSQLVNKKQVWEFTLSDSTVSGNGKYYFGIDTSSDNIWGMEFNNPKLVLTYNSQDTSLPGDAESTPAGSIVLVLIALSGIALYKLKK